MTVSSGKARVVVCGSRFARVYLAGVTRPDSPYELAAVLARGSERSRLCASHYGVPLLTDVDQVPDDVDIACVVIGTGILGGRGAEIAQELMCRGIHVLQEHPLHHDEIAACLRVARRHQVGYRINTLYVHLPPVRRFLLAAHHLLAAGPAVFVDAQCAVQVSYSLFDLLGRTLGGLRPWAFGPLASPDASVTSALTGPPPYRALDGAVRGVPLMLRVQNQIHPQDPDSYAHLLHRISLGTEGGVLTLASTHGPVLWSPRPMMPRDSEETVTLSASEAGYLDFPSAEPIGPPDAATYREVVGDMWPAGVLTALDELRRSVATGEGPMREGQYHLTLARLWQDATVRFGSPDLLAGPPPAPVAGRVLVEASGGSSVVPVTS